MPSSIRQLASPILLKLSMSLPSNSEAHPVSLEACGDQDKAAKPTTSNAMAERRFMKILPFDVVFDTGPDRRRVWIALTIAGDKTSGKPTRGRAYRVT